jgi:hypothetical protein
MANFLQGWFTGITFLVLVNILIALLAGSVFRVYDEIITYNLFQRAELIFGVEKSWSYEQRKYHVEFINKNCNPMTKSRSDEIENKHEKIEKLEEELHKHNENLEMMKKIIEKTVNILLHFIILDFKQFYTYFKNDDIVSKSAVLSRDLADLLSSFKSKN